MRFVLLFILCLRIESALADTPVAWTYCDSKNKAYNIEPIDQPDCPKPRPGEPPVVPDDPSQCPTKTVNMVIYHSDLNYICAYPTAADTKTDESGNSTRCVNADKKYCQLDAGGVAGPGGHYIPSLGWYHVAATGKNEPTILHIKCQCGCFVGETLIATGIGYARIDSLAEQSKKMPVGILQIAPTEGTVSMSRPLHGPDFTVGPEEKPVIRIATRDGAELAVTELHPILVERFGELTMVQAKSLLTGDVLMDEDGKQDAVFSLESYKLNLASANVFNFDTGGDDPENHVISANKILVGDLYWQKLISEISARADNLLNSAQQ